jgi:hypothetical protein
MTDLINSDWQELDANNTNPSPNGIQGGYSPSQVAPILRSIRGSLKRFFVTTNALVTSTGSGTAYVLTYGQAPSPGYSKGIIYRFYAHVDNTGPATIDINGLGAKQILSQSGAALTAGQIKTGRILEVAFNGTSFEVISNESHDSKFTGNTTFTNLSGNGALLTSLNGSAVTTGTVADARLPTTMAGKSFSSTISVAGNLNMSSAAPIIQMTETDTGTIWYQVVDGSAFSLRLNSLSNSVFTVASSALTFNGNAVWHAGNDGAGSGLNADLLDGQDSSYYTAITSRLGYTPLNKAGDSMTGPLTLAGTGSNFFAAGGGDNATYATHNFYLSGWNGMGMRAGTDGVTRAIYNFRTGAWDALGGFWKNGVEAVYNNSGTYSINITGTAAAATKATTLARNGNPADVGMIFRWQDPGGAPSYIWGGSDATNMYVYNPANLSVSYANSSGTATNANKVLWNGAGYASFHYSGTAGQPTWLWGASDGANSHLYNPANFSVNYASTANNADNFGGINPNGYAKIYTGNDAGETVFPLGHAIFANTPSGAAPNRNALMAMCLHTTNANMYIRSGVTGSGTALSGTWRARGRGPDADWTLMVRVA